MRVSRRQWLAITVCAFSTIISNVGEIEAFQLSILPRPFRLPAHQYSKSLCQLHGWVQDDNGEWEWEEDDPSFLNTPVPVIATATVSPSIPLDGIEATKYTTSSSATPTLPSGSFRPKQSLGQNFLRDGNTVAKIIRTFVSDATQTLTESDSSGTVRAVELGPGAGALTDSLVSTFLSESRDDGTSFQCIEIDPRSVELLSTKHPHLRVHHMDVMQADYAALSTSEGGPLSIIGNLPYYITSQILFALADASHFNAVRSATVTMQYEVARRVVASTSTKDYGILSVVFQLYAECTLHFKIPPTVFYPQPKVDSALIGLHFLGPRKLRKRLGNVKPGQLRRVLTVTFQQRRKTVRNSLRKLAMEICAGDKEKAKELLDREPLPLRNDVLEAKEMGDQFALRQELPKNWAKMRPEELSPGQFVELTRLLFHGDCEGKEEVSVEGESASAFLGKKVWRKMKHGAN